MIRQFLRNRRKIRRLAKDDELDKLLSSNAGRAEYWRTLTNECLESSLIALLEDALGLSGDVVECGVYRGASLRQIARTVREIAPERSIYCLDSFQGFPESGITGADVRFLRPKERLLGKFKDANDVPRRLTRFAQCFDINLFLKQGYFEHTLPELTGISIAFLHIDCDTYEGHKEVLEALFDKLVPGGIVVFDDYRAEAWPGATKAVDEFLAGRPEKVQLSTARTSPAWYVVKLTDKNNVYHASD